MIMKAGALRKIVSASKTISFAANIAAAISFALISILDASAARRAHAGRKSMTKLSIEPIP